MSEENRTGPLKSQITGICSKGKEWRVPSRDKNI